MAKQRSPNYPATDLKSAIDDVTTLYERERKAAVPAEVAVKAWGYTSLSGVARGRLAALRQYGLVHLEGGKVRVSDRALTLLLRSRDSREWQSAAQAAALDPEIYRELYERFGQDGSDETIRHYLIRDKNFTPEGATRLISSFRATLAFAKLGTNGYTERDGKDEFGDDDEIEPPRRRHRHREKGENVQVYSWPLSSDLSAEVTLCGGEVTPADLDMLKDYIDVAKRALERQRKPSMLADALSKTPVALDSDPDD